jgi:putative FmdB family regulatory protein
MPTYEYGCEACGHEWEQVQRITEPPLEVCPACSKPAAHRLISAGTNFILKGGGWYSDLYSSPSAKQPADAGQKAEAGDGAKEAAKTGSSVEKGTEKSATKPTPSQSTSQGTNITPSSTSTT